VNNLPLDKVDEIEPKPEKGEEMESKMGHEDIRKLQRIIDTAAKRKELQSPTSPSVRLFKGLIRKNLAGKTKAK